MSSTNKDIPKEESDLEKNQIQQETTQEKTRNNTRKGK